MFRRSFSLAVSSYLRNFGIFAHIDAGKTTLSESLLWLVNRIANPGRIDQGTTALDFLSEERARGITIRSAGARLPYKEHILNLIDTPGHVDFSSDVSESLKVVDGAVVVVDAIRGVQAQTINIVHELATQGKPFLIFLNKMDREDAKSMEESLTDLQKSLVCERHFLPIQRFDGGYQDLVALRDPQLEEDLTILDDLFTDNIEMSLQRLTCTLKAVPVLHGSAETLQNCAPLLEAIRLFLPAPVKTFEHEAPTLYVFKVILLKEERLAFVRVMNGRLQTGQPLTNGSIPIKVKNIYLIRFGMEFDPVSQLELGDVGVITGMGPVKVGDVLHHDCPIDDLTGLASRQDDSMDHVCSAVFSVERPSDLKGLQLGLEALVLEDRALKLAYRNTKGLNDSYQVGDEIVLAGRGELHLEICQQRLHSQFKIKAQMSPVEVVFREFFAEPVEAQDHAGDWSVAVDIKPGLMGSVHVKTPVFQEELHQFVRDLTHVGPLVGGPLVTSVIQLTIRGRSTLPVLKAKVAQLFRELFHQAALDGKITLEEPYEVLDIFLAPHSFGDLTNLLIQKGCSPSLQGQNLVRCEIPLATFPTYASDLRKVAHGEISLAKRGTQYYPVANLQDVLEKKFSRYA